jgi:tagatose kinase
MPRILTLGEIVVEIMARDVGQSLGAPGVLLGPYPSGAPAIFIDQVARLGVPAALVGCVGDDAFGRLVTARLAADGVDVSAVAVLPDATTGAAFVTYRGDGGRDFVFHIADSASGRLGAAQLSPQALQGCTHLHVMGSSLFAPGLVEAALRAVAQVRAAGGTVSFDPNLRQEMLARAGLKAALRQVLAQTDIFLPSGDELTLLVDAEDEATALQRLQALGVREVVIKRGAAGASCIHAGGRCDVAPLAVEEIDPTGAGDCFGGAYVACRLLGHPPEEALRWANAAGARAVTRRGPMEGASTFTELAALLGRVPAPVAAPQECRP